MKKIIDLFNCYKNIEFSEIQDNIALFGLAILLLANLYNGLAAKKDIDELNSILASASDRIDFQSGTIDGLNESAYNIRKELMYWESRNSVYYSAKDLKLFRYMNDSEWSIALSNSKLTINDLSRYDSLFRDTPCGKVVSGYAFEYIDPTVESASVNGAPLSYNEIVYAQNGEYIGMVFLLNHEAIYREVFKNGERLLEYNFHSTYPIELRNLSDELNVNEDSQFNANELSVIVGALNQKNSLRLGKGDIN